MRVRALALFLGLAALPACDDGSEPADGKPADVGVDAAPADASADGGGETTTVLRLSYVKEVAAGGEQVKDLWIYDFDTRETFNVTGGAGEVDCTSRSCLFNRQMTWIGWLATTAGGGGFELWVAPVNTRTNVVDLDQKRMVSEQVNDFEFTNDETRDLIVYSKGVSEGPDGTIDVLVEPVAGFDADACPNEADRTACQLIVGAINADGAFRMTDFGSLVILVKTTLSTMTLDFFNISNGAQQTLYTFGQEMMTGSEFSGRRPVGLGPDATYLAVFTREGAVWRVHALEARPQPPAPATHELFEAKFNLAGDCQRPMPYNFNEVSFGPRFTQDAEWIYFLATGDCQQRSMENPTNRTDSDVLRIRRSLEGDVENVTKNPRVSAWYNQEIREFDLSPDGTKLAYVAPRPNDRRSNAVWLINPESGDFDCSRGEPQAADDDRTRCEFLAEDIEGSSVSHRTVRFHEVQVPAN